MKKSIRILCALLVIAMVSCAAVSCTNTPNNPADGTDGSSTAEPGTASENGSGEATVEVTERVTDKYDITGIDPSVNYGGANFTIFTWSEQTMWEYVEGDSFDGKDLLQQAIYDRQKQTEEMLGVKIILTKEAGSWSYRNTFIQKLKASVDNQDHAYDLVGQYTPAAALGAMQGLYMPLGKTKYFNADHEWWHGDIVDSCSINRNLYFVTGSITPTLVRNIGVMMYNLDLGASLGLPDIYELVNNKKWTLEKFKEIIIGAYGNGNADGTPTYSFTIGTSVVYDNIFYAGGFRFVDVDKTSGTLEISKTLEGQPMVDWYDAWRDIRFNNSDVEMIAMDDGTSGFTVGATLMTMGDMASVQNSLRDVDFNFAIFPTPLRDENQDNYHTTLGMWVTFFSIPKDVKNQEMSSAVLETMGYYGYTSLTPTFYKDAFQLRYLETKANADILDLLHDTLTYDTGKIFADDMSVFGLFRQAASDSSSSWTQIYGSGKTLWGNRLANIVSRLGKYN
ncbi:MAG: hypothetical protein MR471_05900 [Clostridia bacterium]|nr:hypothetical protein [Clostridia bacterium]MDY3784820.1 hypothetical protein [Eubacteriales bacterium]